MDDEIDTPDDAPKSVECDGCRELRPKVERVMEQLAELTPLPVSTPEPEPETTPDTTPHSVPWTHKSFGGPHV